MITVLKYFKERIIIKLLGKKKRGFGKETTSGAKFEIRFQDMDVS